MSLTQQVAEVESRTIKQRATLDAMLDFWNELTEWTNDTPHEGAAGEITQMMERHVKSNEMMREFFPELTDAQP